MVGDEALGAEQRDVLAGELEKVGFLAGFWLVANYYGTSRA